MKRHYAMYYVSGNISQMNLRLSISTIKKIEKRLLASKILSFFGHISKSKADRDLKPWSVYTYVMIAALLVRSFVQKTTSKKILKMPHRVKICNNFFGHISKSKSHSDLKLWSVYTNVMTAVVLVFSYLQKLKKKI